MIYLTSNKIQMLDAKVAEYNDLLEVFSETDKASLTSIADCLRKRLLSNVTFATGQIDLPLNLETYEFDSLNIKGSLTRANLRRNKVEITTPNKEQSIDRAILKMKEFQKYQ